MSPATPHMQKLKPGSPRQGTRGLDDARPPGPVAKHQPQRRTGAAAWEAGGGTGPAGVAGADRRLRAGPAGPARHAAGEGDVHGCPPGAAGRPRQVLPSFLRTALGPSCGRCQAHLASALAAPGTAKAEVPARIPSSRPVGSPGLCAPATWPGRLPILPVSQKGPTRPSLRAGSGIRWPRPRSGSRGRCRGQSPCPPWKGYHAFALPLPRVTPSVCPH